MIDPENQSFCCDLFGLAVAGYLILVIGHVILFSLGIGVIK